MEALGDIPLQPPIQWEPPSLQPYQILPLNTDPTCPVDVLWLDFIASCSSVTSDLSNKQAEVEPSRRTNYPSINNLLNSSEDVVHNPLGDLLANILRTYCAPSPLPEQVAVLYKMYILLRVSPTLRCGTNYIAQVCRLILNAAVASRTNGRELQSSASLATADNITDRDTASSLD